MKLFTYWRSTTAYRLRIALNLKGIAYDMIPINLLTGEQRTQGYAAVNPGLGVPAIVTDAGDVLTQSMAILDWLEEVAPNPSLLPKGVVERAHVRAAAFVIVTDIHPVNNLRVVEKLKSMGHDQEEAIAWMNHWMTVGFTAFEALIPPDTPFCFGNAPGLADICLVPQLYNAHRWGTELASFTRLTEIETNCLALPAFDAARPEAQPDAT